jgi:hypothetical protein
VRAPLLSNLATRWREGARPRLVPLSLAGYTLS